MRKQNTHTYNLVQNIYYSNKNKENTIQGCSRRISGEKKHGDVGL